MHAGTTNKTPPRQFRLVGGHLCLDFCNTVGGLRGMKSSEHLGSYADFVAWCQQSGLLTEAQADSLLRKATNREDEARVALSRAIELREGLYRIFTAVAEGRRPPVGDLDRLNAELAGTLGRQRVVSDSSGFAWRWGEGEESLDGALGPIAHSAADLLTSPEMLPHVRRCESGTCGWLFLDSTKNHSRRWCEMRDCGNLAKARRYRLKQRRARGGA